MDILKMITRSSKHILKFSNKNKLNLLSKLFDDYQISIQFYIGLIWDNQLPLDKNLSSKDLPDTPNINHSRWKQVIYKQASEIIRSNSSKKKTSKPEIKSIGINIDSRFIDSQFDSIEFNEFIRLKLPYFQSNKHRSQTINIPIKYHKQSNKFKSWTRKNTIRLTKKNNQFYIWFTYEKDDDPIKFIGNSIGYDIGYKTLLASSKGELIGKELEKIYGLIANKKRGSKNYKQLLQHKYNEINRLINKLVLTDINFVIMENLKSVKKNSKFSKQFNNKLQYWSYAQVLKKIENICQEKGIRMMKVSPSYTSQICSCCGNLDRSARTGELYHCSVCGMTENADVNAARNILHRGVYSPSNEQSN